METELPTPAPWNTAVHSEAFQNLLQFSAVLDQEGAQGGDAVFHAPVPALAAVYLQCFY